MSLQLCLTLPPSLTTLKRMVWWLPGHLLDLGEAVVLMGEEADEACGDCRFYCMGA